ncbi:hypothetical protein ACIGXM_03645 [Kitasatospora sp. NPDC052896]|uniref:hypothetical protein n=1 Tax=Kitasatospora sp. NPDC052896 TaxID=3364061 RepID=UPI0037CA0073
MTDCRDFPRPEAAYADAPSIPAEISWVADQAARRPFGQTLGREFLLRKAAVVDRIALKETAMYGLDDIEGTLQVASEAALQLIEYDEKHSTDRGHTGPGSIRFSDPIIGSGYRAYVRQEYLAWRRTERS